MSAIFERTFRGIIQSQVTATNVPEEFPAEIPRLVLRANRKEITMSNQAIQLTMGFDKDSELSVDRQFEIIVRDVTQFWRGVCEIIPESDRADTGFVIDIAQPNNANETIATRAQAAFGRFGRAELPGEIQTFEFRVGIRIDGVFKSFAISQYEKREGPVPVVHGAGSHVNVNVSALPIRETGSAYKFDVNNKASVVDFGASSPDADRIVIDGMRQFVFHDSQQLLGW